MFTKFLISLTIFLIITVPLSITSVMGDSPEKIKFNGPVVRNVLVTFVFYDDYISLNEAFLEPVPIEGFSICERNVKANIAFCEIHQIGPVMVDDNHTLTMGHEVLHGVVGSEYHE